MPARPEIFISAASQDLRSCRHLVRDALLTLGCVPILQDHFPPGAGEVRSMLREKIVACQAVIHLAGECYGNEPQQRDAAAPRRSYTQIEYDIAEELKKPLYTFVCAPDFPYDAHEPESADLRALQDSHRAALTAGDHLYLPVKNPGEVSERVRELQTRVETLAHTLRRKSVWQSTGVAAAVTVSLAAVALLYGVKRQGDSAQRDAETRAARAEMQMADLRNQLSQQTKLISLVSDKLDRHAISANPVDAPPGIGGRVRGWSNDPTALARDKTARELGISITELQGKLSVENADVRALLPQIELGSAAEGAKAQEWRELKRAALTKLGDAEYAAGNYSASLAPYQQALDLCDKVKEPSMWCDAAQNVENALYRNDRYSEARALMGDINGQLKTLPGSSGKHLGRLNRLSYVKELHT